MAKSCFLVSEFTGEWGVSRHPETLDYRLKVAGSIASYCDCRGDASDEMLTISNSEEFGKFRVSYYLSATEQCSSLPLACTSNVAENKFVYNVPLNAVDPEDFSVDNQDYLALLAASNNEAQFIKSLRAAFGSSWTSELELAYTEIPELFIQNIVDFGVLTNATCSNPGDMVLTGIKEYTELLEKRATIEHISRL
tara:strand:+ start:26 stop:610 length:585 start_codon:yes stop_codon:yes gene_type:complete